MSESDAPGVARTEAAGRGRRERLESEMAALIRDRLIAARRSGAARGEASLELTRQLTEVVEREAAILPRPLREELTERVRRDTVGLGRLEELLVDPSVEEVMVNGPDQVYAERGGRLEPTGIAFRDEVELREAIDRMLGPAGRRVDELSPMADARLADGSRVNVVIPPLAVDGPSVSIRRFARRRPGLEVLVAGGSLGEGAARTLIEAVESHRTILISGGTGAGKTTLLGAIAAHVPTSERVVTIEDAAELRLSHPHVVRLEARPAGVEGRGEVAIRDLVRNALRMRPDRLIVGEVRGAEALDLLTALNTGHRGALATVHANSADDALRRLETLTLMAGIGLPHGAIAEQVARAIDVVVHVERLDSGARRVAELARVEGAGRAVAIAVDGGL